MTICDDALELQTETDQDLLSQPFTFAIVPEWVIMSGISDGALRCYAVLARCANESHRLWPSQVQLGQKMKRSERQIRRYMIELQEIGALREERRRFNGSTIWILAIERPDTDVRTDRTQMSAQSGHACPPNESHERKPKNESHGFSLWSEEQPQTARDENDFANPMETAFEEIWKNYPRKMAKPSAFKAWRATVRRGAEVAELAQAVGAYADECVRERREPKFIKHGSTFFGPNEPWRDYVATIAQPESVASSQLSWQERILAKAKTKSFEDEIAYLITAPDLWLTKDEFEGMVEHLGSEAIDQIEREVEEAARG